MSQLPSSDDPAIMYVIENITDLNIGVVVITTDSAGPDPIPVGSQQFVTAPISGAIVSMTVLNQTVMYGSQGPIQLPNGHIANINWEPQAVEIIDPDVHQGH